MPLPAPNDIVLQNFEENFERAAIARIAAGNIDGLRARSGEEEPEFSVSVEFALGVATGAMHIRTGTDPSVRRAEYCEYLGTLEIQIKSNRPTVAESDTEGCDTKFSEIRAKVRAMFMESEWPLNDENLLYYRVSQLRPAGTISGIVDDTERDVTQLRYDVKFAILREAWPAAL